MYSKEELKNLLGQVPEDFEATSSEFWSYIEEKLKPFMAKLNCIYSSGHFALKDPTSQTYRILKELDGHAQFLSIDDPLLVAEAEAWVALIHREQNQALLELFEENTNDRIRYASNMINTTLRDGEIGVIFTTTARTFHLAEDIKIVKMCPFDPKDYLNRHLIRLQIKKHETQI